MVPAVRFRVSQSRFLGFSVFGVKLSLSILASNR